MTKRKVDWDKIATAGFFKDSVARQEGVTDENRKRVPYMDTSLSMFDDIEDHESFSSIKKAGKHRKDA
jgi:hypothetical protein